MDFDCDLCPFLNPSIGYNVYGQLGDNSTTARKVPTPVVGNATWEKLPSQGSAAASAFTCAIMANKTMACWVSRLTCVACYQSAYTDLGLIHRANV